MESWGSCLITQGDESVTNTIESLSRKISEVKKDAEEGRSKIYSRLNNTDSQVSDLRSVVSELSAKQESFMKDSNRRHEEAREDAREHRQKLHGAVEGLRDDVKTLNSTSTELLRLQIERASAAERVTGGNIIFKWAAGLIAALVAALLAFAKLILPASGGPTP